MSNTAAKQTNQAGIIAQAAENKPATGAAASKTLKAWVMDMEGQFAKALPKVITPERFTRIALTALSSNPKLSECSRNSFLGALMQAAQLGVEPNTPLGQAYLIPFHNNNKKVMECQFQLGYKGMIDLCYRSGEIASVQAHVVYENDKFEYELGLEPKLSHIPAADNRGKPIYVYATFRLKNGGYGFEVMSMSDAKEHGKRYSKTYGSGPWQTNFEEMAKKTVLKKVLKYAPLRSDFLMYDNTVNTYRENAGEVEFTAAEDTDVIIDGDFEINTETGEAVKAEVDRA